jgi:hypothetical protein
MMMILKIIIFLLLFLYPNLTFAWTKAGTIYTTDGSYSDVSSAISSASTGDTVSIPSGTFGSSRGWSSPLTIQKKIILQGAGMTNTIIESTANPAILLNSASARGIRITGIKFNMSSNTSISITAPVTDFRIDHCHFNYSQTATHISITYGSFTVPMQGLVDNCRFDRGRFYLEGGASGTLADYTIWSNPTNLGGANFLYVEDCEMYHHISGGTLPWHILDGNMAAGYVSRYNKVYGYYYELHGPEHESSGGNRGGRKFEIYRNYLYGGGNESLYKRQWRPVHLRSGTGVIFQNEVLEYSSNIFYFTYYRWSSSRGGAGLCDGANPLDNNDTAYGWLCMDQPGAGKDLYTRTAKDMYSGQEQQPIYLWGNTTRGSPNNTVSTSPEGSWAFRDHFKADRDIFIEGYGTIGMSSGTLAKRPATCTVGQGYWATDQGNWNQSGSGEQGVLYKCTAPNTWTLYYTPYTYPHPLRQPGGDPPQPQPPRNLRIIP